MTIKNVEILDGESLEHLSKLDENQKWTFNDNHSILDHVTENEIQLITNLTILVMILIFIFLCYFVYKRCN